MLNLNKSQPWTPETMQLGNPLEALHAALAASCYRDLPPIEYETRDWDAWRMLSKADQAQAMKTNSVPSMTRKRAPQDYDVEIIMFPQTWGRTALGYGGMGGAAVTPAYTVVVSHHAHACVYFGSGGELAYGINLNELTAQGRQNWTQDLHGHKLADRAHAAVRYEKVTK